MTNDSAKPPVWFWIVSAIAVVWNGMGIKAYLDQAYMTPEKLATLPEAEQAMYSIEYPAWVTAAFAIAVFGGTIGSILLLIKKKLAYTVLVVSLIGIIAQMTYAFLMDGSTDAFGPGVLMPIMIILIGIGLVYVAKKGISNGWLN